MINVNKSWLNEINKKYKTNYKKVNGSFDSLLFFVVKLDNDLMYFNKVTGSIEFKILKGRA